MGRIKLARDRGQCQAVVKTVMNLRVSSNAGNFLVNWTAVSLSEEFFCTWLVGWLVSWVGSQLPYLERCNQNANSSDANLSARDIFKGISVHARAIRKCSFKKCGVRLWTGLSWLRTILTAPLGETLEALRSDKPPVIIYQSPRRLIL